MPHQTHFKLKAKFIKIFLIYKLFASMDHIFLQTAGLIHKLINNY
jgi:hypothetical protein